MASLASVFKAYDVRGIVPDELDERVSRAIGTAFARFTGARRLVVGRDMRTSSEGLAAAFVDGATSVGASVADLGLASTDLLYFASGRLGAPGAMFTASHNPPSYNGIKLCLDGARPIGEDSGLREIRRLAEAELDGGSGSGEQAAPPSRGEAPGSVEAVDLLDAYADHVRSFVDPSVLAPLKVVADAANGMAGLVVPRVFAGLPFELDLLYGELDGTFPHHPADPINPENLADLRSRVLETGADVGLAFDGDADRVFLVDERAEPLSGSLTTALVATAMLVRHPGATVLYNLICSKAVPEVIAEAGGKPVRTRVGHSFIKAVMAETGAVFGGEHSGHYYYGENFRADSGIITAMLVLELMSRAGRPLSELRRPLERYADSGEINVVVADQRRVLEGVARHFADLGELDWTDGLTVELGDWWFNLRPSNTEPLLRLNLEARTRAECERHVAEVLRLVEELGGPARQPLGGPAATASSATGPAASVLRVDPDAKES
jgi:phosphomannomutase